MDIIVLLLAFLLLFFLRPASPEEDGELSSWALLPVRGFFALFIILVHVSRQVDASQTFLFRRLPPLAFLVVGGFFAFSGYALSAQVAVKKEEYLNHFVRRRLRALLPPYLLLTAVFLVLYAFQAFAAGKPVWQDLARRLYRMIRSGITVLPYSWYVEAILFLYLLFFLAHRLFPRRRLGVYAVVLAGLLLFGLACAALGYGDFWYRSLPAFPAGMLFYDLLHREQIQTRLHRLASRRALCAALLAFCLTAFCLVWLLRRMTQGTAHLLLSLVACVLFSLGVLLFLLLFRVNSRILAYTGKRSYELYLSQGLPILLIDLGILSPSSGLGYLVFVLAGTLVTGEVVYRVVRRP